MYFPPSHGETLSTTAIVLSEAALILIDLYCARTRVTPKTPIRLTTMIDPYQCTGLLGELGHSTVSWIWPPSVITNRVQVRNTDDRQ